MPTKPTPTTRVVTDDDRCAEMWTSLDDPGGGCPTDIVAALEATIDAYITPLAPESMSDATALWPEM